MMSIVVTQRFVEQGNFQVVPMSASRQERPFPKRRFDPGCVKTCTNRAVAELFSPFLCFNDGCVSTMAASAVLFLFSVIE
jgi:hypothetical protein